MKDSDQMGGVFAGTRRWLDGIREVFRRRAILNAARSGDFNPLYAEAEAALNEAIWQLGSDHPDTARKLAALAAVHGMRGEAAKAVPLLHRSISVLSLAGEAYQREMFGLMEQLAELHRADGNVSASAVVYADLIEHLENAEGSPRNLAVARLLDELALVRKALGHGSEAKELHSRALLIWESVCGPGSPEVARCLTHLASLYLEENCYEQAEPLLLRAVDEWKRSSNPNDLYAIITLSCCGDLYRSTGRTDQARGAEAAAKAVLAHHAK